MAFQTRGRDPLLDTNMQAAIEKRGLELVGIGLLLAGVLTWAMLWSYAPTDPSFMVATDAPVQNWLGRFGASIAGPLFMIVGKGAWALPAVFFAWGARFMLHRGQERAIGRLIFFPIFVAVAAMYGATLTPPSEWTHSFGLGGLFGETALAVLLNILPFSAAIGVKLMAVVLAAGSLAMGLFVLGFIKAELRLVTRFLLVGLIMTYAQVLKLLGKGASGAAIAARKMAQAQAAKREERAAMRAEEVAYAHAETLVPSPDEKARVANVVRSDPAFAPAHTPRPAPIPQAAAPLVADPRPAPEPEQKAGLLARLMPKPAPMPEPELVEPALSVNLAAAPTDDRVQARISDAIKNRVRQTPGQGAVRVEPQVTRRGPDPLIADTAPMAAPVIETALPSEPVVMMPEMAPAPVAPPMAESAIDPVAPMPAPVAAPKSVVQHPVKKPVQPSTRAKAEAQPALQFEENAADYELPPLNLLRAPDTVERHHLSDEALEENARMLESVLDDYGVKGEIVSVRPGPVVTMYELEPAPGLKASRVIGLSDDIARSMSALSARVSTVPGRSVIGIELPNENREMVVLREILSARDFGDSNMRLPLALGKDIGGDSIVANLAKMPHLLIAGTTGSGKSVAINTMILSLLYKLTPEECRLIMIDPKMLELSVYDGIPHLLSPVVTDPKKAVVALKWTVGEMEERYRKMSKMGVRNIEGYNSRVRDTLAKGELFSRTVQTGFDDDTGEPIFETEEFQPEVLPYIVVIVDEMADLMMVAGKEIEACIQRLAQMARASGIHLIMATQRPSVDVITGTIKANFPTRISFQVTSKIDSRTILGEMGAEQLLGMGDMLYMAGGSKITRVHGPFCSDEEVEEIVNYLKAFGPPKYMSGVVDGPDSDKESDIDAVLGLNTGGNTDGEDALYDTAVQIVIKDRKCSTSYIQRKLAIGYNKAARLVEQMEDQGLVSPANHVGKREILVPEQQ
ncbi:DNA translocase FtsK [Nereida sp. MMG025]|uniref:DNA translocase FtsK n=1 Tax=Nereida sp. MMG025 TaxID=2909981 RepID=UPI001F23C7B2|nr:DNA translocase FtsK [Nereida sp. MMG025]MCF6444806.1 DNA translocase FtsK 4TM domain-containing protein [Nereida sp. MMG025]